MIWDLRNANCNLRTANCGLWSAICELSFAICELTCNLRINLRIAIWNLGFLKSYLRYANCDLRIVICETRFANCDLRIVICEWTCNLWIANWYLRIYLWFAIYEWTCNLWTDLSFAKLLAIYKIIYDLRIGNRTPIIIVLASQEYRTFLSSNPLRACPPKWHKTSTTTTNPFIIDICITVL